MQEEFTVNRLVFNRPQNRRLQIGPSALAMMSQYIQNDPEKTEAGGVLLGRHILETSDIIVDCVTVPMPQDQRGRLQFFRSCQQHQKMINHAWQESGGTCTYLGEWHTHPEPYPMPSRIDRLAWQQKLLTDQFTEPIFFAIVGLAETRIWEGRRGRPLIPLRQVHNDTGNC